MRSTITRFGGLRRSNEIGKAAAANLQWLETGGWKKLEAEMRTLNGTQKAERRVAKFVDDNLRGFGPKQSRNFLQVLGLTKYETPIDSRIIRWLNDEFGFPIRLTSAGLADRHYYNFVLDGFQAIARAARVKPCILDAMVFASFDREWAEGESIW